jgi:energy-coupling factor transport system ATP-binding protein
VLDEPTSDIDFTRMREVADAIGRLLSLKKMVFVITHDMELARDTCSSLICLEAGRPAIYKMKKNSI